MKDNERKGSMRQSQRESRKYLIIGLCVLLIAMAVGYAAFRTTLTITGTSNITSEWNVKITNIEAVETHSKTVGGVTDKVAPTHTDLTATFSVTLTSPGDYKIYRVKVENLGTINAVLNTIDAPTNTDSDIHFYVNEHGDTNHTAITDSDTNARMLTEGSILNKRGDSNNLDEGYVYVKVRYEDYPGQTSPGDGGKSVTKEVTLTFNQTNNEATPSGGGDSSSTIPDGYYVFDTTGRSIGSSYTPTSSLETWPSGRTVALKYVLDGSGNIAEAYACTKFSGLTNPVCLRGGSPDVYSSNPGIIAGVQALPEYSTSGVSCSSDGSISSCRAGGLSVDAGSIGAAIASDSSSGIVRCYVSDDGNADCDE